jgi:hypothetical protein
VVGSEVEGVGVLAGQRVAVRVDRGVGVDELLGDVGAEEVFGEGGAEREVVPGPAGGQGVAPAVDLRGGAVVGVVDDVLGGADRAGQAALGVLVQVLPAEAAGYGEPDRAQLPDERVG